jgi:hypothetical protein
MPACDLPTLHGRFLQAIFSRRFENGAGYALALVAVAAVLILFIPLILERPRVRRARAGYQRAG